MRASPLPAILVLVGGCLVLFFGSTPDLPLPKPEPTPVAQKWQVCLFHETAKDVEVPLSQRSILTGLACRQELEAKGHRFVGSFDVSSFVSTSAVQKCVNGVCRTSLVMKDTTPAEAREFWEAAKTFAVPSMAIRPLAGGPIQVFSLPADPEALYAFLEAAK
jgi:hypothetical protein